MLKFANARVHTDPASTCASSVTAAQRLWPMPIIATQASADSIRSSVSLVNRWRSVALDSAPSIAPTPKPPSRMPKVARAAAEQVARHDRHQRRHGDDRDRVQRAAQQDRQQVRRETDVAQAGRDRRPERLGRQRRCAAASAATRARVAMMPR